MVVTFFATTLSFSLFRVSWGWVWLGVVGVSVNKLNTDLLGQGKLNLLAGWGIQGSDTLLNRLNSILNHWNSDALVLGDVLTADHWQSNGLVDTGLDWLWVGNGHSNIDWGHDRHIVLCLLGNLIAVLVAISLSMSITIASWLTNRDHLHIGLLLEGDLNCLSSGCFLSLLVAVGADLIGDLLDGLSADSPGHVIAKLYINNLLDGQVNILADLLEGWSADLSNLAHVLDSAVVLWLLIAIMGLGLVASICGGSSMVYWSSMVHWSSVVHWSCMVV